MCAVIILFYIFVVGNGITWGIPNNNHPFAYHMDEWAQAQSIRSLFKHGTSNISGSAHGAIFHFFISGVYLAPFILLRIVNPFIIKSSLFNLEMQQKLFEILRINTLLFGFGSLIIIYKIAKDHLKINPVLPVFFFAVTPIFLALSNYFKYDIALVFWIIFSFWWMFRYAKNPTLKNFFFAGIIAAFAFATKLSALPILGVYILSFFFFTPHWKKKLIWLFSGILIFISVFLLTGIPDLLLSKNDYGQWLESNLVSGPKNDTDNFILPFHYWIFLLFSEYPAIFGRFFYIISVISITTLSIQSIWNFRQDDKKKELFLLFSFFIFALSLVPLKIGAGGNRVLVFLPFFALLSGLIIHNLSKNILRKIFFILFIFGMIFQVCESLIWISTRTGLDPRETSSVWIQKHIPENTIIGLEPIPIFQFAPDFILKEYYEKEYNAKFHTRYNYKLIDYQTKMLPSFIIVSNPDIHMKYFKKSPKKNLVVRLQKEGFHKVTTFTPNFKYYKYINNDLNFYLSAIIASPVEIVIYEKKPRTAYFK